MLNDFEIKILEIRLQELYNIKELSIQYEGIYIHFTTIDGYKNEYCCFDFTDYPYECKNLNKKELINFIVEESKNEILTNQGWIRKNDKIIMDKLRG